MNPDAASAPSLLPWLLAAFVFTLAAVVWLALLVGRLGRRLDGQFAEQHLQFVKELQTVSTVGSDRVIDLVAGEVDNLRDRLDAEQAASRQALQQLHLALVAQLGSHKEEMTLRLADLLGGVVRIAASRDVNLVPLIDRHVRSRSRGRRRRERR